MIFHFTVVYFHFIILMCLIDYTYMERQRIHSFQLEIHSKPFIVHPLGVRHCSSLKDGDAVS